MSFREYYTCKNCGFTYMDVNYYFCLKNETGLIEKYESLFSTVGYSEGSFLRGRVVQHYCKNCDKVVSVYQTGLGSSLFTRDSTIDVLKELIPKKLEKLLKTAVLLTKLSDLVKSDADLGEVNGFLEKHDNDLYYKINPDDYLKEQSGCDLNKDNLNFDISKKLSYVHDDLMKIGNEIPCINYYGDDFNITLDGEEIDTGICPKCDEKFYDISACNPCPKCGKDEIEYNSEFCD